MALRRAGEGIGINEKIETIYYSPGKQGGEDLEAGTNTITATAKPGTPDYTTNLTLPASPDSRLVVESVGLRLEFDVDSMTAGTLYYAVDVAGTQRLTGSVAAAGAGKLDYVDLDVIAGEIALGSAQTIDVFFWVDSGNAVISLVKTWIGLGSPFNTNKIARLDFSGMVHIVGGWNKVGTGTISVAVHENVFTNWSDCEFIRMSASAPNFRDASNSLFLAKNPIDIRTWGTVGTDLIYIVCLGFILRRIL